MGTIALSNVKVHRASANKAGLTTVVDGRSRAVLTGHFALSIASLRKGLALAGFFTCLCGVSLRSFSRSEANI